ncbi:hypothetical protein [Moorena sp. SIO4G3]|uniref:hypothetical protein n=1 Tax=Moorena sp. SIO4G3 TaxID=2607821 RepID=UPI00142A59F5|nr:hypothetical protein [Moorena sp. SIO4G3]NEO77355.1 hypothetical protein [Moorena sp. SIO4G3]
MRYKGFFTSCLLPLASCLLPTPYSLLPKTLGALDPLRIKFPTGRTSGTQDFSLFPVPYSLFPTPDSRLPAP